MELIFETSVSGRLASAQIIPELADVSTIPASALRSSKASLPEVSELDVVRHFSRLADKNFSIDKQFYPLGSCTMKYNPYGVHVSGMDINFNSRHPFSRQKDNQGVLQCFYELQEYLKTITGMVGVALSPMAGSQGEFAGVAMIKAYHQARGDTERSEIIVPDAAHGTNPASAVMCGYKVREVATSDNGDIDLEALKKLLGPKTAGIMLTNPTTCGVFGRKIKLVAQMVHEVGGLLYYDGANLNAILGKVRPGDMGFDVMHLNLHKTFATPHGGGGPGAGPVAVNKKLLPYLPVPIVGQEDDGSYRWLTDKDCPETIGRLSCFMGNAGILLRAYSYIRLLGKAGLHRVAEFATLNANYLMQRLADEGFQLAYPGRRASHEFIISFSKEKKQYQVTAKDIAKRLLDFGMHAPTTYFPLLIPECFLIEPTETESKETLDRFIEALITIRNEWQADASKITSAPHSLPVKRLDDVKAARELDIRWQPREETATA